LERKAHAWLGKNLSARYSCGQDVKAMFETDLKPPKIQPADFAITATKLIAKIFAATHLDPPSAIAASHVIDSVFRTPYEKRKAEVMEDQILVLQEAVKRHPNLTTEDIEKHHTFISASIRAAQIGFNTHEQEKRAYLRNALLNVLLGTTADETKQQIFFNAIEAFAAAHVKALQVLAGRATVPWPTAGTFLAAIEATMPKFKGQGPLIDAILNDLNSRGFTAVSKSHLPLRPGDVTNLGVNFLDFVSEPPASA
jgi:hypothetical protein